MADMNRRGFFGRLAAGAAAVVAASELDPDFLVWKPGAKTVFIPPAKAVQPLAFHKDAFALAMDPLERGEKPFDFFLGVDEHLRYETLTAHMLDGSEQSAVMTRLMSEDYKAFLTRIEAWKQRARQAGGYI